MRPTPSAEPTFVYNVPETTHWHTGLGNGRRQKVNERASTQSQRESATSADNNNNKKEKVSEGESSLDTRARWEQCFSIVELP